MSPSTPAPGFTRLRFERTTHPNSGLTIFQATYHEPPDDPAAPTFTIVATVQGKPLQPGPYAEAVAEAKQLLSEIEWRVTRLAPHAPLTSTPTDPRSSSDLAPPTPEVELVIEVIDSSPVVRSAVAAPAAVAAVKSSSKVQAEKVPLKVKLPHTWVEKDGVIDTASVTSDGVEVDVVDTANASNSDSTTGAVAAKVSAKAVRVSTPEPLAHYNFDGNFRRVK